MRTTDPRTTGLGRRLRALLVVALALAALVAAPATKAAPGGLEVLGKEQPSARLTEFRLFSPAMGREVTARVLTPAGFDRRRDRLPVLWLLHGGFGSSPDWTTVGNAEALTAGLPLIVVMPDAGTGGWYADWRNETAEGPQRWETHHLRELRPFIEKRYGTRTDRGGRAVAGLSMGGFGAIHYAARHPDLFGFAASFSGAVDILHHGVSAVVSASPLAHDGLPGDLFGDRVVHESRWRANNPVDLAANLRTVEVQLRTGNGEPGGEHGGGPDPIERGCYEASTTLHQRLDALGIPHVWDDYGPGAHTWEYWQDSLEKTLPGMMAFFGRSTPAPATVKHVAFEPGVSVWGFDVALDRPVYESSVLGIRPGGFDLTGTGPAVVTTPARYRPGRAVRATLTSSTGEVTTLDLVAGADGRLTVPVDLGPASLADEYPAATAVPRPKVTVKVDLTPLR